MLSAHCSHHGRNVLIPTSRIDTIQNTERHIVVGWHCSCGTPGTTRFPRRRALD
jgi:hypothetical protein